MKNLKETRGITIIALTIVGVITASSRTRIICSTIFNLFISLIFFINYSSDALMGVSL